MDVTTFQPLGAEITGVRIPDLTDADIAELRDLLASNGVLVFRGQHLDDDAFLAFLQQFGELTFTTGETPVDGYPDLNVISNVGRAEPPRSNFHVDSSYMTTPPAYTALRAVEIPSAGGETVFTNQYRAFDTLPVDVVENLRGRTIHHVVTGIAPGVLSDDDDTEADHPVFREHPLSGRTALYLTTPARCASVSGLDAAAAAETIEYLFAHSTMPDNSFQHRWAPGDVVIWDNGCVLHRGDHSVVVGKRVMHRGMVADYRPAVGAAS